MSKSKSTFYTRPTKLLADYVWWCINENTLNLMTWEREHAHVRYDTIAESWKLRWARMRSIFQQPTMRLIGANS